MDKDFLLENETAKHLFHEYAEKMPLVDYHCHISPKEIYENRRFDDMTQAWLGGRNADGTYSGDHYKWRLMRFSGVSEDYVTGDKPAFERFCKFAEALELAIGNPLYHWCNLELHQYFGITEALTPENAKEIWNICNEQLRSSEHLTPRGIIERSNVAMIGTTDDPTDSLEWHRKIADDETISVKVCPSFRPDKALHIHKNGFTCYMEKLAKSVGKDSLPDVAAVCDALSSRIEFFKSHGCRASDHGLEYIPFCNTSLELADKAYKKALAGESLSKEEAEQYQTFILLHLGREYHRLGIVMQIHYSCLRNTNQRMLELIGPDAGFDTMAQNSCGNSIPRLLSALDYEHHCPKIILYSLNPSDNQQLDSLLGSFQSEGIPGKIQHGSAWWFNDTKSGMEEQMKSLANMSIFGNFVGMLTDSRSFFSYARHDYFRRILCNLIGTWVENGEYPNNEASLKKIVEGICYGNAARFFEL